jgi:3-deoxy-D-manno-octulosonic-acid transferase
MIIIYRILINLIIILSPLIIIFRLIKKKEDSKRFKEKFCFFSKLKKKGKLVWFHGASVGELQSIVPILEKLEENDKIQQVLITSNTLSSSKVLEKLKFKKVIHQFFPVDNNFLTNKFLDHWQPSMALFIDSEIWPNMISNLNKKKIPIILLNARITKKSFIKWKILSNFSKKIFSKINLSLASNTLSKNYLKKLGAKNIKLFGNLKFAQSEKEIVKIDNNFKNFIFSKKSWCASSTHYGEEKVCGIVHQRLKTKYKNLLTIVIPRHIDRIDKIKKEFRKMGLKTHIHKPMKNINKDTDIYLVNTYGQTKAFFNECKNVFLGGSIIKHGGQNPLEAARFGCNILHGPNISNFSEIYSFLKKNKISKKFDNINKMVHILDGLLSKKNDSKTIIRKIDFTGKKILELTYKEIYFYINTNETS